MALLPDNGYTPVRVISGDGTAANFEAIHFLNSDIFPMDMEYGVAGMMNAFTIANGGTLQAVVGMVNRAYHEYPESRQIKVTAAASVGDTTITVGNNLWKVLKKGSNLSMWGGSANIRVTADPTSSTVAVAALPFAIAANTFLQHLGINASESWTRPTGVTRAPAYHVDILHTCQRVIRTISNHAARTAFYPSDTVNQDMVVQDFNRREWARDQSYACLFSAPRNGGSQDGGLNDGIWATAGLHWRGLNYNPASPPGGIMTMGFFNRVVEDIQRRTGSNEVGMICGRQQWANLTSWQRNGQVFRRMQGDGPMWGTQPTQFQNPYGVGVAQPILDISFDDNPQFQNDIVLFSKKVTKFVELTGGVYVQKDVQDPGTGNMQDQVTRMIGVADISDRAGVTTITGVSRLSATS